MKNNSGIIFLTIFTTIFSSTFAQQTNCGSCTSSPPTKIQCISERQYYNCADPELKIYTCLRGYCTADDPNGNPCSETLLKPQCSSCNQCNGFTQVTCTSLTGYRFCDAAGEEIGLEQTCPVGSYCNIVSRDFISPCSPFSGQEVLCYREGLNEFCKGKLNGNYADPESNADQCNTFIACVDEVGTRHTCISPNNFSPNFRMCVNPLIYKCL